MFTKSTPCAGCHTGLSTDQHEYLSPSCLVHGDVLMPNMLNLQPGWTSMKSWLSNFMDLCKRHFLFGISGKCYIRIPAEEKASLLQLRDLTSLHSWSLQEGKIKGGGGQKHTKERNGACSTNLVDDSLTIPEISLASPPHWFLHPTILHYACK